MPTGHIRMGRSTPSRAALSFSYSADPVSDGAVPARSSAANAKLDALPGAHAIASLPGKRRDTVPPDTQLMRHDHHALGRADPDGALADQLRRAGVPLPEEPDLDLGIRARGQAQGGARPVVLTARLNRHKICKRARRGCPRRAVLRLTTNVNAKVQIRFLRKRHARSPKLVRKRSVRVRATKRVVIMAHKLRVGRYSVAALAREGSNRVSARQGVKLRVRR